MDNNMEMFDEMDNTIVLIDEEGNEVNFEFLDLVEYEGQDYAVLIPADEEDESGEVVILKVEAINDEEDAFEAVESEEILQAVFNIFKERFKDEFKFAE